MRFVLEPAAWCYRRATSPEFLKFCTVGFSGVFVNIGLYLLFTRPFALPVWIGSPIAIELSIVWCFLWNEYWTFNARTADTTIWGRLVIFHAVCAVGGVVNYAILVGMVALFGWYDVYANLLGIALGVVVKYAANSLWTWRIATAES